LHLTPAQIAAAMALGIRFTPATPDQVQRLSMQRKIFRIDAAPHLATRDGSCFETAAIVQIYLPVLEVRLSVYHGKQRLRSRIGYPGTLSRFSEATSQGCNCAMQHMRLW
jgi:hypothetical protein